MWLTSNRLILTFPIRCVHYYNLAPDLLKRHGIFEIAVTVQYLPQVIKNHFGDGSEYGVRLHYFEEDVPLGTAGSVKNAEAFLDGTFVVISGDALTDFNLQQAIEFHRAKQAIGTLVMTRVEVPVEYGVVMTDLEGRITRFLEKPSWSEVFSDTVNTGIYVFEPEVLSFFQSGEVFDFSKDLFPLLMKNNHPLYGYVAEGYWSDIGNLVQYRQSQFDMLDGLVNVNIKGERVRPGVWVGENAEVHPLASIEGPAFIGEGTIISEHAKLKPYSVTGRFNRIHFGAQIEKSVLWNRNSIGSTATLEGATVCNGVKLGVAARLQENAVIGDNSRIGDKTDIHTNVKVWPDRYIESETIVRSSLIWGKTSAPTLLQNGRRSGDSNVDVNPEFTTTLISAYASCLPRGAMVTLSCDDEPYSNVMKYSVLSALLAAGVHVQDLGSTLKPLASFGCRLSSAEGGVHIFGLRGGSGTRTVICFLDRQGRPISKSFERNIESAFAQEDYARPGATKLGRLQQMQHLARSYFSTILNHVDRKALLERKLKVVYGCDSDIGVPIITRLLQQLGCVGVMTMEQEDALGHMVSAVKADVGVYVRENGTSFHIVTSEGQSLLGALRKTINSFEETAFLHAVNTNVSKNLATLADRSTHSQRDHGLKADMEVPIYSDRDALYSLALLLDYLAKHDMSLQEFVHQTCHMAESDFAEHSALAGFA
ncbi:sugar phosphate nucleotidyltransferase [Alicyclobacillus fastidiosus]|uniref:Sugar phosphate nucleotidyltransferase n=1 Tax=Alicyclobacillus fastidiosus TaxID=392011 RepID=A0ABY6ZNV6_9BACL|nr:sugar phosphate nucleotidyltransferase [Alicyclobacillus fastidiosus]WAH44529.1 sugar phosphate nucleotidyltransferase [Alicyclobacillus fastidiosus]